MRPDHFKPCIEACSACADACDYCAASCLHEEDVEKMSRCIALDMDCAEICRAAAGYMSRGSEFSNALSRLCAEICEACAAECAKHPMDHCQACAEACRRTVEACRGLHAVRSVAASG